MSSPDLVEVRMLRLPVQTWARAQQHSDELLREFALVRIGTDADTVPSRLLDLVAEVTARYGGTGDRQREELFRAAAAGREELDVVYALPPAAGPACEQLGALLDEADEHCRSGGDLLTLATPPELVRFRRWYLGEVVRQTRGEQPLPWPAYA